jgi:hypothetical protein
MKRIGWQSKFSNVSSTAATALFVFVTILARPHTQYLSGENKQGPFCQWAK